MICAIAILALAACSDFSSGGTSMPGGPMPPMNEQNFTPVPSGSGGISAMNAPQTAAPRVVAAMGAPAAADTAVWPFAQAGNAGLPCPTVAGYSCMLHFNEPTLAVVSKNAKSTASPSPSPSPSPSDSPTSSSPSPSPSPTPAVTLALQATPKDVPALPNPDPKALSTTALLALRLRTNADVTIDRGVVRANFTLPAAQIPGRGFAVALFSETINGKKQQHEDKYLASYSKSTLSANTLQFAVRMPSVAVKKDETWLFVLYGDERPDLTPSPAASASPSASASPAAASSPAAQDILSAPVPSASP